MWDPVYRRASLIITVLALCIGILQGIQTFGGTKSLLKQSTANLKIDTRDATLDDVLGRIEFYPARSESSATTSSTERPTAVATQTSSTSIYLTPTILASAERDLQNITEIIQEVIDDPDTREGFSVARVFDINDFMILGTAGFTCYSDNKERDNIRFTSGSFNSCPTNGFLTCFGSPMKTSQYSSSAYVGLNSDYLITMTALDEDLIDDMSIMFSNILQAARTESLALNIPKSSFKKLLKLSCGNDYMLSSRRGGSSQKYASTTWALGLTSVIFIGLTTVFYHQGIYRIAFWFVSFALFLAQYAVGIDFYTSTASSINLNTQGIEASGKGYIGFFIALIILHVILGAVLVYQFMHTRRLKKMNPGSLNNDPPVNIHNFAEDWKTYKNPTEMSAYNTNEEIYKSGKVNFPRSSQRVVDAGRGHGLGADGAGVIVGSVWYNDGDRDRDGYRTSNDSGQNGDFSGGHGGHHGGHHGGDSGG